MRSDDRSKRSQGADERRAGGVSDELASAKTYPLSFAQARIFFLEQLEPGSAVYNLPMAVRLGGLLDQQALERSFETIAERHEILRSTFHQRGGEALQRVEDASRARLAIVDLTRLGKAARAAEAHRLAAREATRSFDLGAGPPFRLRLLRLGKWDHALLLTMHHIVSDGWSLSIVLTELNHLYEAYVSGEPSRLAPLPVQYGELAERQRRELEDGRLAADLDYWLEQLRGAPTLLPLPTDRPRPAAQRFEAEALALHLDAIEIAGLRSLARSARVSLFSLLAMAWAVTLARLAGVDELLLGTPSANRQQDDRRELIGVFINTLALRVALDPAASVVANVQRLGETVLAAQIHQELPFEKLVEELKPERSLAYNPLLQAMFIFQNMPRAAVAEGTSSAQSSLVFDEFDTDSSATQFDLSLVLEEVEGHGVSGQLRFASALFDRSTARRIADHFLLTARSLESGWRDPLAELPRAGAEQLHQQLIEWNESPEPPAARGGLVARLAAAARAHPERSAVRTQAGRGLTYGELEVRSTRLAHRLRALGVGSESPVAVAVERSPAALVALFAVWKAGACYVPLVADHPVERLRLILEDARPAVLISDRALDAGLGETIGSAIRLDLEEEGEEEPAPEALLSAPPAEALAYVLFTSGSTGRPKGVEVSHGALAAFLDAIGSRLGIEPGSRLLAVTPLSFDIAGLELFLPLVAAGEVIVADDETTRDGRRLRRALDEQSIDVLQATPATWRLLVEAGGPPADLLALCGGEALPPDLAASILDAGARLWNLYGPTESTIWSTARALDRSVGSRGGSMPLGRPIAGTRVYVADRRLRETPIGAYGELLIAGRGLARGYHRRPALTAERFVPDPFSKRPGERAYRTGDVVRRRADGDLDFLGRADHQIKLRGHRIELGEIEAALRAAPEVAESAVVVRRGAGGQDQLAGFVVAAADAELDLDALRGFLRGRLPEIMVPQLHALERLPLNANGKVDRRALSRLAPSAERRGPAPPSDGLEARLRQIWARILELPDVAADDNFFDLGGHSLLLMRLREALESELDVELELIDLFRYPSVRALAEHLGGRAPATRSDRPRVAERTRRRQAADDGAYEAVAIIGMAGRFPRAADVEQLWSNLRRGVSGIRFFSDEELAAAGIPAAVREDPSYVPARGLLDAAEHFDPGFFGFLPRDAEVIDPQHRVLLEVAWEAFEDAGYVPGETGGAVGVYAGASANTYWLHLPMREGSAGGFQTLISNDKDFLSTRLSYKLNLTGPSMTVQTACSTSLVAVHAAVRSLLHGECDMALAGGVSIGFPRVTGYTYREGMILSPDGHCRAFDAEAQGTVSGEGAGMVLLKRLSDALADGDRVRAVIRGTAVNNDGAYKVSYTAPSLDGQVAVIAEALDDAGVNAEEIGYVEAHGTATPLGDPIEVRALTEAYRRHTRETGYCGLGSIKSNIGHLDAAAGIAGLIKAALSVERGELPPTLDFERANPQIDFAASPFYVADALRPWPDTGGAPRRAAVSSFGIGGTNAHAILEQAPPRAAAELGEVDPVIVLSARSASALDAAAARLAAHLGAHPDEPIERVAATLQHGRKAFEHRRAFVARSGEDAVARLEGVVSDGVWDGVWEGGEPSTVLLFPGQGVLRPGLGAALAEREPAVRETLELATEMLRSELGADLGALLFPAAGAEADARQALRDTRLAQPALFALEVALGRYLERRGVKPAAMLGHSLGEYSAACLAGVFSFLDGLRLVAARGRLMSEQPPGAMAAVSLSAAELDGELGDEVEIAALNAPRRSTITGSREAVEGLVADLRARGVGARLLATAHGFHSRRMEGALEPFRRVVGEVELAAPRLPFLSNVSGDWIRDEEATDPDYWVRQLRSPVRFAPALEALAGRLEALFVEVGPGHSLSSLVRQHPATSGRPAIPLLGGSNPQPGEALARLWVAGVPIRWSEPRGGWRMALPTYPFERQRLGPDHYRSLAAPAASPATGPAPEAAVASADAPALETVPAQPAATGPEGGELHPVLAIVEELAGLPADSIDRDVPFPEAGVDSLLLVQFSQALEERLGIRVPMARLMEDLSSLARLMRFVDEELGVEPGSVISGAAAARAPALEQRPAAAAAADEEPPAAAPPPPAASTPLGPFQPFDFADLDLHDEQRQALERLVETYTARTATSKRMADEARAVFADNRASVDFRLQWKEMVYQIVAERSAGSRLWDVDGNEYVDLAMGFGVHLFGHSPPWIVASLEQQIARGLQLGPQSELAGEVAAAISRLTGVERVTFANTGSEAVMTAVRLARAVTGREKIVVFAGSYHGSFDGVLLRPPLGGGERALPLAPGVSKRLAEEAIVLPYGEEEALERIAELGSELAAVLVEPVQSRRPELQPRRFLRRLRRITEASGAALVFDEVITGFRCHPGGAQAWFGVEADIVTYGKVLGGGMPIGVVAGKARYLDAIDGGVWRFGDRSYPTTDKTFFAGTFCKHPLTMAASRAVLAHLEREGPGLQEVLNRRTAALAARLNVWFHEQQLPFEVVSFASLFRIAPPPGAAWGTLFFHHLALRGVYTWEGRTCFLSTAHSEADIEHVVEAIQGAALALRRDGFLPGGGAEGERTPVAATAAPLPVAPRSESAAPAVADESSSDAAGDSAGGAAEDRVVEASRAQRQLFVLMSSDPAAARAYHESSTLELRGALRARALEAALAAVVARHDALRSAFDEHGERLVVAARSVPRLPWVDLSALGASDRRRRSDELARRSAAERFDLHLAPPLRLLLLRLSPAAHVLTLTVLHALVDGRSQGVLLYELAAIYAAEIAGEEAELPPAIELERALPGDADAPETQRAATEYWEQLLAGIDTPLELPADRPRGEHLSFGGDFERLSASRDALEAVRALARKVGTLPSVVTAAYALLLHRLTGRGSLVLGVPSAGQRSEPGNGLAYDLVVLPLPSRLDDEERSFSEHAAACQRTILEGTRHRGFSWSELERELGVEARLGRTSLVSTVVNFDRSVAEAPFGDLRMVVRNNPTGGARFELGLNVTDLGDQLLLECKYRSDLYDASTIARWLRHYRRLLASAAARPNAPWIELELLEPAQRHQLLVEWDEGPGAPAADLTLAQGFERQARATPRAVAVAAEGVSWTYADLDRRANAIAAGLVELGAGAETVVAVWGPRAPATVAALLGVLKAGAAYLPLDTKVPAERVRALLADAGAVALIAEGELVAELAGEGPPVLALAELAAGAADRPPARIDDPAALAYVIYTSGSTGRPKGVAVEHRQIVAYSHAVTRRLRLPSEASYALVSTLAADLGNTMLFPALLRGGSVLLPEDAASADAARLVRFFGTHPVDCLKIVPSHLAALLAATGDDALLPARRLVMGGEALTRPLLATVAERAPRCRVFNHYGPTETTVGAISGEVALEGGGDGDAVALGRPLPGARAYVVGPTGLLTPPCAPGELWIGGAGVSRGYLGRPALTAAAFVPDPFGDRPGRRLYRTGDRVRQRADGRFLFLGRADDQVKVRGFRVELGEIESALRDCPGVEEAAVLARPDRQGETRLVGYVAPAAAIDSAEVLDRLRSRLPGAMVPALLVELDRLPLNANGKVDRRALPEPGDEQPVRLAEEPMRSFTEEIIAGIWQEVLKVEQVAPDDDFLALGGHSLLALLVISRITQAFEIELPLEALFEAPTVAELAAAVDRALGEARQLEPLPPIEPLPHDEPLALSFGQQRLWLLDRLEPGSAVYNIPGGLMLEGELVVRALARSFDEIVRRHEILRTTYCTGEGGARQRIHEAARVPLPAVDLSGLAPRTRRALGLRLAAVEARRPFDLERGPVFRLILLRLDPREHFLLTTMHHIASDGWSRGILSREVAALYTGFARGESRRLPELEIQYADFAAWQRRWLEGEVLGRQIEFWRRELEAAPELLAVPTDRPRPPVQTFDGASETLQLSRELAARIEAFGREHGSTLFMTLVAVFQLLLARLSGQYDVSVGTPVAGRHQLQVEALIGFFVNTLVLRSRIDRDAGFLALLENVRRTALAATAHQDVPFETLVVELGVERNMAHSPLFQAMFIVQNNPGEALVLPGVEVSSIPLVTGTSKFDMNLSIEETPDGLFGYFEYNPRLYDATTARRFLRAYETLLEAAIREPQAAVERLPLLSAGERHQMLLEWNDTAVAAREARLLHQPFETRAAVQPDAVAVVQGERELTYRELDRAAGRLARHLIDLGVGAGDLVGVLMPRTPWMVVAVLGILKAGAGYAPLSTTFPRARQRLILEQLGARVLISGGALLAGAAELAGELAPVEHLIALDDDAASLSAIPETGGRLWHWGDLEPLSPAPAEPRAPAEALAYVIFTSGSTGAPKGVMVQHAPVLNLIAWFNREFEIGPRDRVLFITSLTFDLSVYDIFGVLAAGGSIRVVSDAELEEPQRVLDLVYDEPITLWDSAPAALQQLAPLFRDPAPPTALRAVFLSGDWIPVSLPDAVRRAFTGARVVSLGGATEATIWSNYHRIGRVDASWQSIPYGRPIDNARYHVLDRHLAPRPIGVPGDLFIAGEVLAGGYFGQPALTAWQFVPDPWSERPGGRMYRTGDRARHWADGELEFLGRLDHQVKVRGFRIELGEIEVALARHPQIETAVALVREDVPGQRRLVAYVVPLGVEAPAEEELRRFLAERLPEYMVPARIVPLETLPVTSNGKLDRGALPAPEVEGAGEATATAPRTPEERQLAAIWTELLGLESVGIHQRFVELGGDSVLTIQAVARAAQQGLRFTARQLYEHQTIAGLAQVLGSHETPSEDLEAIGEVALTPAARWFFEQEPVDPQHFNQALLLHIDDVLEAEPVEMALRALLEHHHVLRSRFARDDAGWRHRVEPIEAQRSLPLAFVDLEPLAAEHRRAEITRLSARAQASLGLERGPVLRALALRLGSGETSRLLLVLHHLVVDGVSWRILLADLQLAYDSARAGREIVLPPAGTSFRAWARALESEARSPAVAAAAETWLETVEIGRSFSLPREKEGENTVASTRLARRRLGAEVTAGLLTAAARPYRSEATELLVAALARVLAEWSGSSAVWLELERHGRDEDIAPDLDLSRTIGWFTTLYPVALTAAASADDPGARICEAKERLRGVPHRGRSFGELRSPAAGEAGAEVRRAPRPEVLFNYLGQLDRGVPEDSPFRIAAEPAGADRSPRQLRAHVFEINTFVAQGRLEIEWRYSEGLHRRESVERLAEELAREIEALVEHCLATDAGALTPSDFPLAALDASEVAQLVAAVAAADGVSERQAIANIDQAYPLSPLQRSMLLFGLSTGDPELGFEQLSCILTGELDLEIFERTWRQLTARHDALRTGFVTEVGEEPLQVVRREVELTIAVEDWRQVAESELDDRLRDFLERDRARGFRLESPPLTRLSVLRLTGDRWFLVWSHHHLVLDGWCRTRIFSEVLTAYQAQLDGVSIELDPSPPFGDFIAWLAARDPAQARRFWRRTLRGFDEPTPLVVDRLPERSIGSGSVQTSATWSSAESEALRRSARRRGVTLSTMVQAAWGLLLARYSGRTDVLFGATVAGRPAELPRVEAMIGMFINNLPVRLEVPGEAELGSWLDGFQAWQHDFHEFEFCSLDQIQEWSGVSLGRRLFDSLVVFQNYPVAPPAPEGSGADPQEGAGAGLGLELYASRVATGYPLTLVVHPDAALRLDLVSDAALIEPETGERMLAQLGTLLRAMLEADDDVRLDRLSLWSDEERAAALPALSAPGFREQGLTALLVAAAERRPAEVAVRQGERELTYGELADRGGRLAASLLARVAPDGEPAGELVVALQGGASIDALVAVWSVLVAGCACLPVAADWPEQRRRDALLAADPALTVIVDGEAPAAIGPSVGFAELAAETAPPRDRGEPPPRTAAWVGPGADDSLHALSRRELAGALTALAERLALGPGDGVLVLAPVDSWALAAMLLPLVAEARLELLVAGAEEAALIAGPRVLVGTNAVLQNAFVASTEQLSEAALSLDHVVAWGAPVGLGLAGAILSRVGSMWSYPVADWRLCQQVADSVEGIDLELEPEGRALVLDRRLEPTPPGVPGELWLRVDRAGPDAELWRPDPAPGAAGTVLRTGLLARRRDGGRAELLGRPGERIERAGISFLPAEIESALRRDPAVLCAVVQEVDSDLGERVVAWIGRSPDRAVSGPALSRRLRQTLPQPMVPSIFVPLQVLPITATGAIDEVLLVERSVLSADRERVPPRSIVEHQLVTLWESLFDLRPLGVRDSFFELGGHSLLAMRMVAEIRGRFGKDLSLRALFEGQTIEHIAAQLEEVSAARNPLVALNQGPKDAPPLLCLHPAGGDVLGYLELAKNLGGERRVYGVRAPDPAAGGPILRTVEEMAEHYSRLIVDELPEGPYHLAGHSFGGYVAVEIARRLRAEERRVATVVLFDTGTWVDRTEPDPRVNLEVLAREATGGAISKLPDELDLDGQLEFLLAELGRLDLAPPGFDLEELRRRFDLYWKDILAAYRYEPASYDGRLVVLRAEERVHDDHQDDRTLGWGSIAAEVEVFGVAGNHYNLLRPPNVGSLTRRLRHLLSGAEACSNDESLSAQLKGVTEP